MTATILAIVVGLIIFAVVARIGLAVQTALLRRKLRRLLQAHREGRPR